MNGIINPIKNAAPQFASMGSNVAESFCRGFRSKQSTIVSNVSTMMNAASRSIISKRSTFTTTGVSITNALVSGITKGSSKVSTAFTTNLVTAVTSIRNQRSNFFSAGGYLAEGFANGITAKAFEAQAAAVAMATAALEAAKDALGIESPSKEAYKMGGYYGLGFVNAIDDYGDKVRKASINMAEYAKSGMSDAIQKIRDNVSGDMDIHPTIRPVVDLSEVKTGVDAINDMLMKDRRFGATTGIGAVTSMMNRRGQNGSNTDIVSAINKLRKDFGELNRPSYTINGITYDDGSEVSEAIRTLVRAAKIERRV